MKKVTEKMLKKLNACEDGREWWMTKKETNLINVLEMLMDEKRNDWANWLIVRCMTRKQCVDYSIFAARLCLRNYTRFAPNDDRVENAIIATERVLENNTQANRSAARSAWSAESARSAESAAESARSAESAARSAAWSAAWSARSARSGRSAAKSAAEIKILKQGIRILLKPSDE